MQPPGMESASDERVRAVDAAVGVVASALDAVCGAAGSRDEAVASMSPEVAAAYDAACAAAVATLYYGARGAGSAWVGAAGC